MLVGFYLPTAFVWNLQLFTGIRSTRMKPKTSDDSKTCSAALVFIIFHFIPRLPLSALQIIDCGGRLCFENMHYSFFFC